MDPLLRTNGSFVHGNASFQQQQHKQEEEEMEDSGSNTGTTGTQVAAAEKCEEEVEDERMSNDESMSSSSSSEMDENVRAVDENGLFMDVHSRTRQDERLHQQQQHQQFFSPPQSSGNSSPMGRSRLFSKFLDSNQNSSLHNYEMSLRSRHHHLSRSDGGLLPTMQHFRTLSLDFSSSSSAPTASTDSTSSMQRKRSPRSMWLRVEFKPAMSKSARGISDGNERMEDDNEFVTEEEEAQRVEWATRDAHFEHHDGTRLVAVRNEVTGLQVLLRSNRDFLCAIDKANWFLPQGHVPRARVYADRSFVPPHLKLELFVVGYVEDENGDMMMEFFDRSGVSSSVAKDHAVYIRIRVTHAVAEGSYEIPLRIFTQLPGFHEEELTWSSVIHLRVMNLVLPSPHEWKFHLDLWQHLSSIARAHGVALWSNRHFQLIDNYFAVLSELGQKCVTVIVSEMPWAGQQCHSEQKYPSALYEHALLEVYEVPSSSTSTENATASSIAVDFIHFDRLLALAQKHHMDAEIEVFGLLSIWRDPEFGFDGPVDLKPKKLLRRRSSASSTSSTSTTCLSKESHHNNSSGSIGAADVAETGERSHRTPSSLPIDSWRIRCLNRQTQRIRYLHRMAEIERFIELFYQHCIALQIVDHIRVCADEPSELSSFYEQIAFLERVAPGFKLKVAMNHMDFFNYAPPQVVDYVPLLPLVCADIEATKRIKQQIQERGGKLCWYVCCTPAFPNQFVSSPLVEGELVGYLTFLLELDGFLRWNYCLWPAKPWENLKWRVPAWKVGDMYFVLPGKDGYPVETLRLESLRSAIQAYELLRLAQETLSPMQMEQLKSEVSQMILRTTDYAAFSQVHRERQMNRHDLYSLNPLDYQRARILIIDTLAAANLVSSPGSHHNHGSITHHGLSAASGSTHSLVFSPPQSPRRKMSFNVN